MKFNYNIKIYWSINFYYHSIKSKNIFCRTNYDQSPRCSNMKIKMGFEMHKIVGLLVIIVFLIPLVLSKSKKLSQLQTNPLSKARCDLMCLYVTKDNKSQVSCQLKLLFIITRHKEFKSFRIYPSYSSFDISRRILKLRVTLLSID